MEYIFKYFSFENANEFASDDFNVNNIKSIF